ncbi:hypothetical protein MASR1M42_23170 [Azonexus hydrophilus]
MSNLPRVHLKLLLAVFVLSGFAGLIYQSVWSHYLGLFLGHAAYAQALVLAIFMGGMAAGAALVARAGVRWGNLVRTYAVIEAVIGLLALVFHSIFVGLLGLSYDTVIPALGQPALVNAYKWALAALLILPQTVLLGMTFPLMSGGIIRRFPGSDGHVLGGLYFTNSIGAALGVLFAAFLIMPRVGLDGAMLVAGIINLVVALLAWLLGRGNEAVRKAIPQTQAEQCDGSRNRLLRMVLFATFLSAAASFAYELIWIRMLSLAVGSTLHAFELMLASFIAGIALGGLWVRRHADTHADPMRLVGWMQVLMGLAALLSLALYANAFTWVGYLMQALARTESGYDLYILGTAAVSIAIMMPAAFFAGTTLPLFTVVLLRNGQGEGAIGRVYAWNTLGAIVGVFATIHFLIPATGLKLGLILAALVDIIIGLVLLRNRVFETRQFVHVGAATALALGALVSALLWVDFDPMRLSSGVYRSGKTMLPKDTQVVFYKDGKTASVSTTFNASGYVTIATNGKSDAAIGVANGAAPTSDEPTMVLLAGLPLAYHEKPRTAAVIGFGSGLSTHTLLADKRLERVDTIEIEQAMIDGARVFGERVQRAYEDPRSRVILDDAKSYFAGQQQRYDFIISEPSNPWISGVGSLFSKEFYHFVPRFLNEGGVFVQWLQLYEFDDELVGSVLDAMTPVFKDYHAYLINSADLVIVASMDSLPENPDFQALFTGELREDLKKAGISHPDEIHYRKVAGKRMLRGLSDLYEGPINSDFFPYLSLQAPEARFRNQFATRLIELPLFSVPLVAMTGISKQVPAEVSPAFISHTPRARSLAEARLMSRLLLGKEPIPGDDFPTTREVVYALQKTVAACNRNWQAHEETFFLNRLQHVIELSAYLGAEERQALLHQPRWFNCQPPPAKVAQAMELAGAMAQQDTARITTLGMRWLEQDEARFKSFNVLVLRWVLASRYLEGDVEGADTLRTRMSKLAEELAQDRTLELARAWATAGK